MEGRIENHGNQKESKKGRQEEALNSRSVKANGGRGNAPPNFLDELP
jgi:hypothetical protein